MNTQNAKFAIGQFVRPRVSPFRGVIFDVDPTFSNTEEYWLSIPENTRPHKAQPFYHLLAENDDSSYVAYVSEQNLLPDDSGQPVGHPQASMLFESFREGQYKLRPRISHSLVRTAREAARACAPGPGRPRRRVRRPVRPAPRRAPAPSQRF